MFKKVVFFSEKITDFTDYTEYSVQPNIRFEPNIRPNNRFSRIFVKTDYSAEYSDKTEYSVEPNIRFQKI